MACTPSIAPLWLITEPREIAIEIEVQSQGPYGSPIPVSARSARDGLPLDTLSLRPIIIDQDGPVDPEQIDGLWTMCPSFGNCILRSSLIDRPPCSTESIAPPEPCIFGRGGTATLPLGGLHADPPEQAPRIGELLNGFPIAFVASSPNGPGLDACLTRLERRERLDGCLLVERRVGVGPIAELIEIFESLGLPIDLSQDAEDVLARPRNRNPAVEWIQVDTPTESRVVPTGARVSLAPSADLTLSVMIADEDLDQFEVQVGEQQVLFSDDLRTQWWVDREIDALEPLSEPLSVQASLGAIEGVIRVYVVIRDGYGAEGWGSIELEVNR